MALTARELALRLAKHIGVTTFDPADPSNQSPLQQGGLRDGDVEDLTACINAALTELWEEAPTILCQTRVSIAAPAPTPVAVTVSDGSAAIDAFPGHAAWMNGATIRIDGDPGDNRVLDGQTLLAPYHGATDPGGSTRDALVYGDCLHAPPGVRRMLDPVYWNGGPSRVRRISTREAFDAVCAAPGDGRRETDEPRVAQVETLTEGGQRRLAIRVYPMPPERGILSFAARLTPPSILPEDLGVDTDPGVSFALPEGWDEAVLLPLALARFSTHPGFRPDNLRTELTRQATLARRIMHRSNPDRRAGRLHPTFR